MLAIYKKETGGFPANVLKAAKRRKNGRQEEKMTWIEAYAKEQCDASMESKAAYEEEAAILALVRARNEAELSQKDVALALNVSQPYIAQVERGARPMSLSLMFRYAEVVGVAITISRKR